VTPRKRLSEKLREAILSKCIADSERTWQSIFTQRDFSYNIYVHSWVEVLVEDIGLPIPKNIFSLLLNFIGSGWLEDILKMLLIHGAEKFINEAVDEEGNNFITKFFPLHDHATSLLISHGAKIDYDSPKILEKLNDSSIVEHIFTQGPEYYTLYIKQLLQKNLLPISDEKISYCVPRVLNILDEHHIPFIKTYGKKGGSSITVFDVLNARASGDSDMRYRSQIISFIVNPKSTVFFPGKVKK